MKAKKPEWEQLIPSLIIGLLGGITLFVVNLFLNKFVFHVKSDIIRTLITALVFAGIFMIVSYQWDKKTKG
jgi:hypothetical protein